MEASRTALQLSMRRLIGFILKEWRQILRNRHLLYLLLIPPTIQLAILAYALRPGVDHMNLGIVDYSRTRESNELVASLSSYNVFNSLDFGMNEAAMVESLSKGSIGAAVVIPRTFGKQLDQGTDASVQVLMDGVDAYSSGIAKSYIIQTVSQYSPRVSSNNDDRSALLAMIGGMDTQSAQVLEKSTIGDRNLPPIKTDLSVLYNPDLRSSWYFIPGVLGGVITLVGVLVSSASLLREKEFGTLDQVLVSPFASWEVLVGKVAPIILLLFADLLLALSVSMLFFQLPFRGDISVFLVSSVIYLAVVVGLGMILSISCAAQRQAQLVSYLILIPVILLSGSLVPANTMPQLMQDIAAFNPLLHYTQILRSVFLKAADWQILWPQVSLLALFAIFEWTFCINRFLRLRS